MCVSVDRSALLLLLLLLRQRKALIVNVTSPTSQHN